MNQETGVDTDTCKIVRKSVLQTDSVRTGFLGFIICLENVYNLAKYLLDNNMVEFLLTYKLSQDHVEMFFALLRRMNGFNNNPTSVQYLAAYKKLLSNNLNVFISPRSNCLPQDNTLLISKDMTNISQDVPKKKLTNKEKFLHDAEYNGIRIIELFHKNYSVFEHNYNGAAVFVLSDYKKEMVKHIAGAVVGSVIRRNHFFLPKL